MSDDGYLATILTHIILTQTVFKLGKLLYQILNQFIFILGDECNFLIVEHP